MTTTNQAVETRVEYVGARVRGDARVRVVTRRIDSLTVDDRSVLFSVAEGSDG